MKKIIISVFALSILLPTLSFASFDTSLKYGSRGNAVTALQDFLQNQGFLKTKVDGRFGLATLSAVKAFQSANGLPIDGYFGKASRTKANSILATILVPSNVAEQTKTGTITPTNTSTQPILDSRGCSATSLFSTTTGQLCLLANTQSTPQNNSDPIPLSQAIPKYNQHFSDETVDVTGTVTKIFPVTSDLSFMGNIIHIQDGVYTASVQNVDNTVFQTISVGDFVEVQGHMRIDDSFGGSIQFYSNSTFNTPIIVTILKKGANSTSVSNSTSYNQNSLPIDYSSFSKIQMSQYANNPSAYSGQKIEFMGSVVAFLPKGGSGGTTNYISLSDPVANLKVMAEVDDSNAYTNLVNKVNAGDTFRVYGIGTAGQNFKNSYGVSTIIPVVQLSAADDCDMGSSVTNMTSDSSPYGWACAGTMQQVMP